MKPDRKTKAKPASGKLKARKEIRQPASKSNGKHAEKKRTAPRARTRTAERRTANTQVELRASQQPFSAALDRLPIGIIESSPDGKHFNVNEEFCQLVGYEKQELLTLGIKDITHEEDYSIDIRMHQKLVAGEIPFYKMEKRYVRKDGGIIWVELTRSLVRDSDGKPLYTIGAVLDISDRKQREEYIRHLNTELQARLDEMNTLLEILPTGVWIGNHDCSVITGNSAAYKILGFTPDTNVSVANPESDIPTGLKIFVNGGEVSPENAPMQVVARSGKPLRNFEHELVFPDGRQKAVWGNVVPLFDQHGKVRKVIASYVDFTERKRAEQVLTEFARQQEALYKLADQLHRTNSFEDVFNAALDAVLSALQCDRASILLFDNTGVMRFVAWRGLSDDYRKAIDGHSPWKPGEKNAGPICISEIDTTDLSDSLKAVIKREGISSLAFIPLVSNGKLIGKLMAYFNASHIFSDSELGLSLTIARQLAFGIDRRRAEEALRQSEERFVQFMRHLPGPAWIKDVQGRYVYANAAAEKAFSIPREELYGKTDEDLFPPEVAVQFRKNDEQALMDGKGVQVIETLEHEDGVLHYSIVSKFPIPGPDGNIALIGGTAFDITENKQAEKNLRESEERFRAIINQATAGIVRDDVDGRLVFVNQAFCEMLGYTEAELMGKTIGQLTHNDDIEENKRLFDRMRVEGISFQIEKRLIRQDGSILWANVSVSPILDAAGKPESAIAVVVDITRRKQAEEALQQLNLQLESRVERRTAQLQAANQALQNEIADRKQAEELLRSWAHIFEHADWGIATFHEEIFVMVNPTYAKMHGYTAAELVGRPNKDVFAPEAVVEFSEQLRIAHEKGHHVFESKHLRKDGTVFPVLVDTSVVRDPEGNILYRASNVQDMTERKQAEEAIRTNEEKLRTLFEIVPVGISFLNNKSQVIQINSALEKILGMPKEKLLSGENKTRKYIRADGTPMPPTEFASTRAIAEQETIHNVEIGVVKEDGELVWTNVSAAPVAIADVGAVVVTADITKRKHIEQALRKSRARMQELSRRLVDVQEEERRAIARELHDSVGQSLSALNLNLVMIRDQLSGESAQHIGPRLDDSMQLAKEAIALVRNVMTDLRPAVLDDYGLEAALNSYIDQFVTRYNIKVLFKRADTPLPRQSPSREMTLLRISQEALTNIARHARANQVNMSLRLADNAICLTVEDNGVGIPSGEEANRPGSHGLKIMRERAEAFDGILMVESVPGKGTKVEVSIPIENGGQAEVQKERRL
jgi:PAS domain S-box-containing protein